MREPLIQRSQRGVRSSAVASAPAPIGGWNARDPEAVMASTEALWLENWWPGTGDVTVRKGAVTHATGLDGDVLSFLPYSSPSKQKLFAATPGGIYDVTAEGVIEAAEVSVVSGEFQSSMFTTVGGNFLLAVNGADPLQLYNGRRWKSITEASSPAITGVDTTSLVGVTTFKSRLWFVQDSSLSAWYLPTKQIAGAAVEFPLGQLFQHGGSLAAITSWTVDGGNGSDDYLVFITTEGEVAVYRGTDPASDFYLNGVYYIGEPLGRKCCLKFGGDVLLLTQSGLVPLSKALLSSTVNRASAVSSKVDTIFSQCASAYGSYYGWCGAVFTGEDALLLNVPTSASGTSNQLVMNTVTGAWTLFTGWQSNCWEVFQGQLYFGGRSRVNKAFTGYNDFGANIVAKARGAFNYFGGKQGKHFKLIRPMLRASGKISLDVGIDVDFDDVDRSGRIVVPDPFATNWDSAQWDVAVWAGDYTIRKDWHSVPNVKGFCASVRLRVAVKDVRVGWSSTDFLFQRGSLL